jgi:N terminus of Rad21 / Rec8 like protein
MALRLCGESVRFLLLLVSNRIRLVATLGSNSSLKTVTRKKILNVDVHRACDTIQNPEAPMALRLQGNLLCVCNSDLFGTTIR